MTRLEVVGGATTGREARLQRAISGLAAEPPSAEEAKRRPPRQGFAENLVFEFDEAYTAFVEGQPHFSRPEIMKRVARVDPALQLSRVAGLRSFGLLLRQGKIRKLQRGQFTVTEATRFNPAHRIAGQ